MREEIIEQFSVIKKLISEEYLFQFCEPVFEKESKEYWACQFEINNQIIVYRKAKITPTKVGQFVTLWKRVLGGVIEPFHENDNLNIVIITTRKEGQIGHFVFPKSILADKGILSNNLKEGKRGFRVYPPWDITENNQAKKTQKWQLEYFLSIDESFDIYKAKCLFNLISK